MKNLIILAGLIFLSGCVRYGVRCTYANRDAWVKVNRIGWGSTKANIEKMAIFSEKVCK